MKYLLWLALLPAFAQTPSPVSVDVCVYGGTSAGVMAAYTAKKAGKSVLLIEPGKHLGGLTTGGLGYTDIGNKYAVTGLARDYYRRIGQHYGKFEQWIFEPHVAENLFGEYIKRGQVTVLYNHRLVSASKVGTTIQSITLEQSDQPNAATNRVIRARQFIDCTYEGDLMAKAGVSFMVGREANSVYDETINGFQLMNGHQFPDGIDPYKIPGNPDSGLLWGISAARLAPNGTGDNLPQAYNYRICLTDDPANSIPITRPAGYDSTRYDLLLRLMAAQPSQRKLGNYFIWSRMPNRKTDINNRNGFSTDMIGANARYPEAGYAERTAIIANHEQYTKGLLYFFGHDTRVPAELRQEMLAWGYPKDEYTDTGNWSPQLYIREARRMIGDYVMTQRNCEGRERVQDAVGMAAYTMDSHNCQRIVVEKNGVKMVKNEGNVEVGGFPPYPIAYRSLTPKPTECTNLLVPVCLSASHIAYGSIRMEPVFMVLGQSAGLAAAMAIDAGVPVQRIDITKLQSQLKTNPLADGSTAEILVDDASEGSIDRVGNWSQINKGKGSYGPSWLADSSQGQTPKVVRFRPRVLKPGPYSVYAYFPKLDNGSRRTTLTISDGKKDREVVVNEADIRVEGQTSGEWVSLGNVTLPTGQKGYVAVSNKNADGIVVADAVLFVPVKQ
ncbi:FAD-dependent oxidoreductase [Spirosoma spitsbergense]|uniref:FAD-dependent oxidoreductase n=1 Tax=Spirosoma spitsbergense TaxID=431554 RepID=UPI00037FBC9C|nr:FAD-dependent oxidoreductase [Spirosoma spitsbergense]